MDTKQREAFLLACQKQHLHIQKDIALKPYTTLQIGGNAAFFFAPKTIDELKQILPLIREYNIPFHVLGNGSNTLVLDEGYGGIVLYLKKYMQMIETKETQVIAGAGAMVWNVCLHAKKHNLSGMEWAYGIPASAGGALYMNAGAYGGEMKDIVYSCTYLDMDGNVKEATADELDLAYRHSMFTKKNYIILQVTYQLDHGNYEEIEERMEHVWSLRKQKQPLEYPSAGSVFKRPVGSYASKLIDDCGLKGFTHVGAQVSEKHAGFLINHNKATSEEFLELIHRVQTIVEKETGFILERELIILK